MTQTRLNNLTKDFQIAEMSAQLAAMRKALEQIAVMEKSDHLENSGDAYAHALGRCNGLAKLALIQAGVR